MDEETGPLAAERQFFTGLLKADTAALDEVLAGDFLLIDVMSGSEIAKPALLEALGSRQLKFEAIDLVESRVRHYEKTAVVTGRTQMSWSFVGAPFTTKIRYTHVYVEQEGRWRLASAQGTQVTADLAQ
jgi:hypothetical protein